VRQSPAGTVRRHPFVTITWVFSLLVLLGGALLAADSLLHGVLYVWLGSSRVTALISGFALVGFTSALPNYWVYWLRLARVSASEQPPAVLPPELLLVAIFMARHRRHLPMFWAVLFVLALIQTAVNVAAVNFALSIFGLLLMMLVCVLLVFTPFIVPFVIDASPDAPTDASLAP
jgi:hypothetical protein